MRKMACYVVSREEIFEDGCYIFYRNREVAGEAAIMQTFRYYGEMIDLKGWAAEKFLNKMKFKIFRILNEISNF